MKLMLVVTLALKKKTKKSNYLKSFANFAKLFKLSILGYTPLMKLKDLIIHEDEAIIVINKPAGLTVHPDGKADFDTLSDMILKERKDMKKVGEPIVMEDGAVIMRPGIVHRLDRDTSGAMVLAKTDEAYKSLKQDFHDHVVKKHYMAICYGSFRSPRGIIKEPIGRSNQDIRKWAAGVHARGEKKEAVTRYMVKTSTKIKDKNGDPHTVSLVDVYPETGRTHQIRVHLQYVQHPIIADQLYASYLPELLGMKRQALHAADITIKHPLTGKQTRYVAELPEDFTKAIKLMNK
jgi:23S rRNA pseudouridine1911/1915/1917 synthase